MLARRSALIAVALFTSACGARSQLIDPHVHDTFDAGFDVVSDALPDVVLRVECQNDTDCNDNVSCTADRCVSNRCVRTPDNTRCDDHLFCTSGDRCDPLRGCVADPRDCSDSVACTDDHCDEAGGRCVRTANDLNCPISNRCDAMRGCIQRALATDRTQMYEIELPDVIVRPVGHTGAVITDLALAPDRSLYGIAANQLYAIDARTGVATATIALSGNFTALDAAPDGTLYAGASGVLSRIDPTTGVATTLGAYPSGYVASGDLAAYQGRLLASARQMFDGLDTLVEFDLTAGTSRIVGSLGYRCVYGLAAFGPTLYGITCEGRVLRIDADTGASVQLASANVHFYGATAR